MGDFPPPLTQLILRQRQVLLHQALGRAERRVHSAADQLGHSALQHSADTPSDHSPGPLHATLHRVPSPPHNTGQCVWDRVLGRDHHILGTGHDLDGDRNMDK